MKIMLVNPNHRTKLGSSEDISAILPPLGICYIAAVLRKQGYEVGIIDMNACNYTLQDVSDIISKTKPDIVGITASTPVIFKAFDIAGKVKKIDKNIVTVMGGAHPTSLPYECIKNKNIDIVVYGEGELTMLEICKKLEKKKSLKGTKGLLYKNKGKIVTNSPRPLIKNLDELPFPAIDILPLNKYYSAYTKHAKFANILTSRGCPGRCVYCNKLIFGYNVRLRSAENIFKEIKYLHDNYGYVEFHIVDDLFTQDRDRVLKFCQLIKQSGMKIFWKLGNGVRVGSVDYELLKKMKESGCYSISFGIESGNQQILNNIKKGQTLKMCKDAVEWANKLGIFTIGFFMIGNLGENEKTIRDTIEFAKSLPLDVAQFSILVPFPGTEIRGIIEKTGKIFESNWASYDNIEGKAIFEHGQLTKEMMERMHKQAYHEFYMRPKFIIGRIFKTRSLIEFKKQLIGFIAILGLLFRKN